ncbi:dolichyl-phosphate-mannose--protein mannosyltransferase [Nocardioides sp. cx-173]|uniref:dolichyl-phosphate-mannose--protein mannosyltransferase n=1 Tax=Nocardioides sp. cx-173 TaxID=2898796 RepID=UPI001E2E4898|nr:phospholipid carrier-dependent glycosyltransferase [Nocardioides sp. cx-173]MCD4527064.1 phospholipid carrier-dependent glycosyltransferase [Nocardioides sp. cx-173]UGB42428.1 phospholipid carrier-dependent glycosyltransferase [Nocardioides sp. cx-173]
MPLLARRRDPEGPLVSWGAALGVTLLALFLRLWRLGTPQQFEFDETYYAKDAWSMLNHGYVRDYVEDADKLILNGKTTGVWTDDPSMVVHPEVGKWIIALGEQAFGMDPFGWRVSAAVVGALMVLVMCRLVRRLTGSTMLGCVAGLLLSFDGLHFVLSRLALLDIFLSFFLLCAVTCLVVDRDWYRARMAAALDGPVGPESWGPVRAVLLRPWLVLGGVCFGLAVGTKWTAAVPLAAFGILVWLWSAGARRASGVRWPVLRSAVVDGIPAFAQLVVVAFVVYIGTWTGWLIHADEYEEHLSATQYTRFVAEGETCDDEPTLNDDRWPTASQPDATGPGEVVQSLRSLWSYHQDLFTFHTHFLNCSDHDYGSKPAGWLLLNRPVGVAADTGIEPGTRGCEAPAGSTCLRQVLLLGTPVLWWGGILALLYAGAMWLGARDWRFGFAIVGTASTWLPWLRYDDRPIFFFYAIATLPFIVVALTLAMGRLIGPSRLPSTRRTVGVVLAGSFFVLVLVNFAWFWPIYTHELLTRSEWLDRIWFARWI